MKFRNRIEKTEREETGIEIMQEPSPESKYISKLKQ